MAATATPRRLLVVAAILFSACEGNALYRSPIRQMLHVDLPSFWVAAKLTFADAHSPYDYDAMVAHNGEVGRHVFPFLYPPRASLRSTR